MTTQQVMAWVNRESNPNRNTIAGFYEWYTKRVKAIHPITFENLENITEAYYQ